MAFSKFQSYRLVLRRLQTMVCFCVLLIGASFSASANWTLPGDAINNVGDFANCTFNAGSATVTCSNSVNLNAANATLTITQDLTIIFNQGINTPDGITINPGGEFLLNINTASNNFNMNGNAATINANISGANITINGIDTVVTGNLSATNNVTVNSGATVFGNVFGGGSVMNNGTINGNITTNGSFTNNSTGAVYGSVTVAGSAMNNGLITGNLDAGGSVTNNSGAVAGSINSNGSVTNNGTVLSYINAPTVTGGGSVPTTCDINVNTGPCAGAPDPDLDYCEVITTATTYGIVGNSNFTYGNGSTINNNTIVGDDGNSPTPVGTVETVEIPFPPIDPPFFPTFSATTNISNQNIGPGTYNEIEFRGNNTFTMSAGTYYIKELEISRTGSGATVIMGAGDYFIEDLILHSNTNIVTTGGVVRLFIRNGVGRSNANQININSSGSVGNFRIYLYDGASINLGNGNQGNQSSETINFNGIIYGPSPTNNVSFGNNNTIQGSILAGGEVNVGSNTDFSYTVEVEAEIISAFECDIPEGELHHYRIRHPSGIVSCYSAPVIVDACADASCSTLYQDPINVTLASTAAGSAWQGGDLTSTSGTNGTLALSNGSGAAGLRNVPGGTTTLSISNTNVPAENATQCFDPTGSTPTSCQINFQTAGLIFTAANGSSPIPDQFAGSPFNVALRAVETNTTTGACEARVEGPQTVNIGVECLNPADCIDGQAYTVDGTPIGFNSNGDVNNFLPVSVTFDATGTATLPHNYTDVGLLRLHGSLTLPPEPNADNPDINDPPVTLSGTSTTEFVVKPYSLVVSALDDENNIWTATTNSGLGYRAAGEEFTVIVQSLNANGDPTPNFGNEIPIVDVSASVDSVVFPAGGELGQLDGLGGFQLSSTIDGAFTNSGLTWSEVGTLGLVASLVGDDYLGGGDAFERPVSPVGRFYPDRFIVDASSVANACTVEGFSYMDQPDILVEFTLHAVNVDGNRTRNYDSDDYPDTAAVNGVIASLTPQDVPADEFDDRFGFSAGSLWANGILTYNSDSIVFNRRSDDDPDGPYPEARIGLQISGEMDNRGFSSSTATLSTVSGDAAPLSGALNLVYGRMVLENTFGPEAQPLPVDLRTQIWNGDNFVVHTNDSCSQYEVANLLLLDSGATTSTADGTDGTVDQGLVPPGDLVWLPPTVSGSFDEFEFEYDAPAWLEFNWVDADLNIHRDPRAFASFGQYRGNDRVIFWLELR